MSPPRIIALLAFFVTAAPGGTAEIHTGFEGGRLGRVEQVSPWHFRCGVAGEVDQDQRNRQANWYYFRLDGARAHEVIIDLVDLPGEYNYKPNRGAVRRETIPVYSDDQHTWTHFSNVLYDPAEPRLRIRFTPARDHVWIAHVPPYTNTDLQRLLERYKNNPYYHWESVGRTPENRDIPLLTVTSVSTPAAGKRVLWLMARQHSWEAGTSWVAEGALRFLLSEDPMADRVRRQSIFKILPLCDPDGVARGGVRFNRFGYDLNRNWDTVDPKLTPEIAAERAAVLKWVDGGGRIDLFLSLHNTETNEYLEGPPDRDGRYQPLLERFSMLLAGRTTFNPQSPPHRAEDTTTPGKPGRMTVVQGLYRDRRIPAFLMEQMIAFNSRLGRLPTVKDRKAFGAALVRTMLEAVTGSP